MIRTDGTPTIAMTDYPDPCVERKLHFKYSGSGCYARVEVSPNSNDYPFRVNVGIDADNNWSNQFVPLSRDEAVAVATLILNAVNQTKGV